jgi:hypothetical protein
VVGFSRKARSVCPSRLGRRMSEGAANLVEHLLPIVPFRQFVLSVPVRLRFRMAYSPDLTTAVLRCFIAAIESDLRRRARKRKIRGDLEAGAMTVVQRFGSSLALNVHFHTLAADGVWARQADGSLLFHPLPAPSDEEVGRIARTVCRKVQRVLARQRTSDDGQTSLLDELANASVQGLVATGPRRGCRVLRLGSTGEDASYARFPSWLGRFVASTFVSARILLGPPGRRFLLRARALIHSRAARAPPGALPRLASVRRRTRT